MRNRGEPIDTDCVVRWTMTTAGGRRQTHYGMVTAVHDDGTVDVEYAHSVPASNQPSGRIVRMVGDRLSRV